MAVCRLCKEKDRTISALETSIVALNELVNMQRALPTLSATPFEEPKIESVEKPYLLPDPDPEPDDIMAQLNAGLTDPETAERLASALQVFRSE